MFQKFCPGHVLLHQQSPPSSHADSGTGHRTTVLGPSPSSRGAERCWGLEAPGPGGTSQPGSFQASGLHSSASVQSPGRQVLKDLDPSLERTALSWHSPRGSGDRELRQTHCQRKSRVVGSEVRHRPEGNGTTWLFVRGFELHQSPTPWPLCPPKSPFSPGLSWASRLPPSS